MSWRAWVCRTARGAWARGADHGIPRCCRARFIIGVLAHDVVSDADPALADRLRLLDARRALADGVVPCELHAALWVVRGPDPATGRPVWGLAPHEAREARGHKQRRAARVRRR